MPEDRSADWPGEESDEVGGERGEGADVWGDARKEQVREHQRRGGAVEEVVVPLDRRADGTGDRSESDVCTVCESSRRGIVQLGHDSTLSRDIFIDISTIRLRECVWPMAQRTLSN